MHGELRGGQIIMWRKIQRSTEVKTTGLDDGAGECAAWKRLSQGKKRSTRGNQTFHIIHVDPSEVR
jgi:hypothetical protein